MIAEIDEALRALLREEALNGGGGDVTVAFDNPDKEWAARQNTPTLNLYLYDVSENLARREMVYEPVRDDDGRVVERRPPPRRFDLAYLVSVWTQRVEDEHRLLDDVLTCLLSHEELPRRYLPPHLADHPLPVRMVAGRPRPDTRKATDVWGAVGGTLKPSIDLLVTTPFVTGRVREAGPPVLEEPRFAFAGAGDEEEERQRGQAGGEGGEEGPEGETRAGEHLAEDVVHGGRIRRRGGRARTREGAAGEGHDDDEAAEAAEAADVAAVTPGRMFVVREVPRE